MSVGNGLVVNLLQVAVGGVMGGMLLGLFGVGRSLTRQLGEALSRDVYVFRYGEALHACRHCGGNVGEEGCTYPDAQLRLVRCVACARPLFYFAEHGHSNEER